MRTKNQCSAITCAQRNGTRAQLISRTSGGREEVKEYSLCTYHASQMVTISEVLDAEGMLNFVMSVMDPVEASRMVIAAAPHDLAESFIRKFGPSMREMKRVKKARGTS